MPFKYSEARNKSQQLHRERNKQKLFDYLLENSCVDCGESDPIVLEFDHVRGEKRFGISKAVGASTRSWRLIKEEIDKCDVRCSNCHKKKTAERGNFWKTWLCG